jgi:uncharacterized protein
MNSYLDLARNGKNDWWRFLLAVLLILFMWQIVGAIPLVFVTVVMMLTGGTQSVTTTGGLPGADTLVGFVAFMLASVFFLAGIFLAIRFIHGRPLRTLVTPERSFAWKRMLTGFGIWFVLSGLMSLLEALLHPGRYVWSFDPGKFVPYFFLALVLIPIQTSTEELFFRGYILQGVGLRTRSIWLLSVISGFLFMVPHFLNPEASVNYALMGLYYFAMGAFLAFITLRDGRLELALGVHAANNLFSVLIANYTISVLPSPSLYTVNVLDAVYSVPAAIIGMGIFVLLFVGPWRQKAPAEEARE